MVKHARKFVSYLRVSTDKQGLRGLGIAAQRQAVLEYLDGGKWQLVAEFVEQESGKRSDRPELAKAIATCKKLGATLVIARLDRLARNVAFISGLMERKVEFVACDMPNATPFMLTSTRPSPSRRRERSANAPRPRCRPLRREGKNWAVRNWPRRGCWATRRTGRPQTSSQPTCGRSSSRSEPAARRAFAISPLRSLPEACRLREAARGQRRRSRT
jgi:hypothetical protein